MVGEGQWCAVAVMVLKGERAVYPPSIYYAEGHLDTVDGLCLVSKQRNDVCRKCYGSSKFSYSFANYGHGHYTAHADGVYIADLSSVPRGELGMTA